MFQIIKEMYSSVFMCTTQTKMLTFWISLVCLNMISTMYFVNGTHILGIFSVRVKSHFSYHEAMMRALYMAGHHITLAAPFPQDKCLKNYSVIDTSNNRAPFVSNVSFNSECEWNIVELMNVLNNNEEILCNEVLKTSAIQEMLFSEIHHYDVMFVELLRMHDCFLLLAEKLKIPVIGTVSTRSGKVADALIGNPHLPAIIPLDYTNYSNQMTFFQRMINFWHSLYFDYHRMFVVPSRLNKIYEKFSPTHLSHKKKISLIFNNNHFSFLSKTALPNFVDIGGIHLNPIKPLPQNFQDFIDQAKYGVVLFSLGSVVKGSAMPTKVQAAFREAFAEIPQRVIWKFEKSIEDLPHNVFLTEWIPQRDILAHKNVKVFISHCGQFGSYEAISGAIPMIFTPLLFDQKSNAALLESLGVGVNLDFFSVTKEKILHALNTIVNDTRYANAMKELSRRFHDRPLSPQKSIVYWTEYVIRHNGTSNIKTEGADMPLYQYLLFDVILFALSILSICTFVIFKVIRTIFDSKVGH